MSAIALTGGKILDNKLFEDVLQARNYTKWKYKQRTWFDESKNVIRCKFTGRRIEFIELNEWDGVI